MIKEVIKTGDYDVVALEYSDSILVVDKKGGRYNARIVDFKTTDDYRRFMDDLRQAHKHPDDLQDDIVVEHLFEKLNIEWKKGER